MSYKKLSIISLILLLTYGLYAQSLPQGNTDEDPLAEIQRVQPFKYEPVDPFFWRSAMEFYEGENYQKLILEGADVAADLEINSDEALEGHLAVGMGLRKLGFYFAASEVFKHVIQKTIGSQMAQQALLELDQIAQTDFFDKKEFGENILIDNEFGPLHPKAQSFVSYYNAFYNLIRGFKNWADVHFSKVQTKSYWDYKIQYFKALSLIARGQLDSGELLLSQLIAPEVPENIRKRAQLQLARINFEKKDFLRAEKLYQSLPEFPLREKGRILLELAWTKFYLKNYSRSLGILEALRAPIFNPSTTPERYILEMIILKQLCHFDAVGEAAKDFYNQFGPTLRKIRDRKDLEKDKILAGMTMMHSKLQYWANYINQLRDEYQRYTKMNFKEYLLNTKIKQLYRLKEQEIQNRMFFNIRQQVSNQADIILDTDEQIKFLDYTSKIDALRIIKKGENRNYISEKVSYVKFDKIYWPVVDEFWMDEIDNYKVLINSQCDLALPSSTEDDEIIEQFGEEFE